MPQNERDCASS